MEHIWHRDVSHFSLFADQISSCMFKFMSSSKSWIIKLDGDMGFAEFKFNEYENQHVNFIN